jgi:hypothetical protein
MASSRIRRRRPTATWDEVRGGWNRGAGVGILFVEQREEATEVSAPLAHRAALPRLAAMDYSARRRRLKVRAEAMMILGCSDGGLGVSLQACDGNDERHRKHRLGR